MSGDEGCDKVPNVPKLVQELIRSLFNSTFSHTDEDMRCYR